MGSSRGCPTVSACSRTPRPGCARSTPTRFGRPVSGRIPSGEAELHVGLHPATPAWYLTAGDSGNVRAIAETVSGGPGYHRFVGSRPGTPWQGARHRLGRGDRGHHVRGASGGRDAPTSAGSARPSRPVRNARQRSSAGVQVGTPPGTRYTFEGAIATSLGPRDDAWLESADRRPAHRDRDHAVVAGRDRRALPAESGAGADVARGALAQAGGRGRGRAPRGRPSAAVEGLPARARACPTRGTRGRSSSRSAGSRTG